MSMGVKELQTKTYSVLCSSHIGQRYGTGTATVSKGYDKGMALWYIPFPHCGAGWYSGQYLPVQYGRGMGAVWHRPSDAIFRP